MSYLVLVRCEWHALRVNGHPVQDVAGHLGEGFLPIFETYAEARREYPDSEIREITTKPIQAVIRGGIAKED